MRRLSLLAGVACLVAASPHARAEGPSIATTKPAEAPNAADAGAANAAANATVARYDALNDQIALLKQEKEVEDLRSAIAQAKKSRLTAEHEMEQTATPDVPADLTATPSQAPAETPLPRVLQIIGDGHRMTAELSLSDGSSATVQKGSPLPGGLVVDAVGEGGVTVRSAKGLQPLSFDNGRANIASSEAVSGASPSRFIPGLTNLRRPVAIPTAVVPFPPIPGSGGN